MEIKSLFELPGSQSSLSSCLAFYNAPEVVLSLYDEIGNEYRLELNNRKKFIILRKKKISWCNGWQLESNKLLQTNPSIAVVEDTKLALKILDEASRLLNNKYFPSIIFPDYGKYNISNVKSLLPICDSFEQYLLNLINEKIISLNEEDKEYLRNISLQQLITVLNCYELNDHFVVKEKKINESKVLHKHNFEYVLSHSEVFNFPMKEKYSEFYKISFSLQLNSDLEYSINDIVEASLTFDYFSFKNIYVFNYTGIKQAPNPVNKSSNNANQGDSRCFVVTAVTGDVNHPIVKNFRAFRDDYLLKFNIGNKIVSNYYKFSPPFANLISKSKIARFFILNVIIRPIHFLLIMHRKKLN
jgi:hypothetical protein